MHKSIMGEQKPLKIFTKVKDSSFHSFETRNNLDPKVVTVEVHALVKCSLVQSSFLLRPQVARLLPCLALAAPGFLLAC